MWRAGSGHSGPGAGINSRAGLSPVRLERHCDQLELLQHRQTCTMALSGAAEAIMLARTEPSSDPGVAAAVAVLVLGAATLLGAWFFQYALGMEPCPLCLEERIAYYVSTALALVLVVASGAGLPRMLLALGLALIAVLMLGNAGLGVYHSGVEWKLWPGPQDCSGSLHSFGRAADLLKQLSSARVVRCDEAAWRFLGLSLAGYNVLISIGLAAIATFGAIAQRRRHARGWAAA